MLLKRKIYEFTNGEIDRKAYKGFFGRFWQLCAEGRTDTACLSLARRAADEGTAWVYSRMCRKIQRTAYEAHHMPDHPDADLPPQSVVEIMKRALDYDIITRGGGGDFPRNVMVSPLTGVEQGEYFDVMPTAQAVNDYLLAQVREIRLPRKLKVGSPMDRRMKHMRHSGIWAL